MPLAWREAPAGGPAPVALPSWEGGELSPPPKTSPRRGPQGPGLLQCHLPLARRSPKEPVLLLRPAAGLAAAAPPELGPPCTSGVTLT